jgi:4-amino-4-deoxy-L-arabinose transferase-like glycosyltransferase
MAKYDKRKIASSKTVLAIVLLVILLLGQRLRFYNYDVVPHPGETADEYGFAWAGLSLIKDGVPESWSSVNMATITDEAYENVRKEYVNVDGIHDKDPSGPPFSLVKPWFDKPPGFALFIGSYSYFKGAREYVQTGVGIIRRPMVRIALITTILIFFLGYRLFDARVGLVSALLYSTIPTMVISSRLVLSENGYIPIFLAAILAADYYLEKKQTKYWLLAAVLAAFGILFKLSAVAILMTVLLIYLIYLPKGKKKFKIILLTSIIGISGFLAFALFGAYYDWGLFYRVFNAQSNLLYGTGSEVLFSAVTKSLVATRFFTDGWMTLGWIAFLLVSFKGWRKTKGATYMTVAFFSYLAVFLVLGSEPYGWYRYPLFPFLAISIAKVFIDLYDSPNLPVALILFLLPFGTSVHKLVGLLGFQMYVPLFRVSVVLILSAFAYSLMTEKFSKPIKRGIIMIMFALLIYLSMKVIYFYNYDNWFFVT